MKGSNGETENYVNDKDFLTSEAEILWEKFELSCDSATRFQSCFFYPLYSASLFKKTPKSPKKIVKIQKQNKCKIQNYVELN